MSEQNFAPVNTQVRFPAVEKEVLEYWQKEKVFEQSLRATKDKEAFVFYDGPPFATGLPHYGHLLAGTLKDIIPRYWTMRGHYVERRFGWDCHGLPVENEMEKELKVSGKQDIEKLGIAIFNEACRSIVLRYTEQWEEVVLRMGRWVDFVNQYRTMDPPYMESIWWVFKQIWDKKLVYKGFCVQPYCPRCATPLSNFELNEGYRDVKGPSITVTFPLVDDPNTQILVWTTTPWTLPSNVLLAVGADIDYVKVRDGDITFIMAKDRLPVYYNDESEYELVGTVKGKDLVGLRYQPMFDYFVGRDEKFFQITDGDFVSTEDGSGIVHIAPAFGEDDFKVGEKMGIPIMCPVDAEGKFTEEVSDYQGQLVFDADEQIIIDIKKMGRLIHRAKVEHRYPFCYRCDTALLYKAIDAWFVKIDPLKPNMLENNQRIHWVPDHLKEGRFGKALETAPDWNISRNRYWGTPIPIWTCQCGHEECVGSLEQLHALAGKGDPAAGTTQHTKTVEEVVAFIAQEAPKKLKEVGADPSWVKKICSTEIDKRDIHRHIVDRLTLYCPQCSEPMTRIAEVLDCWFESGSMPYAQNHYPFENKEVFEKSFPADFIAEGLDQTRGWFNKLTVLASALFEKEAFKNVIVNGIILAEDGKKLSKRLKNYTPTEEVLDKLGSDALRLFLINSPAVKAEDLRFSDKGVMEMARSILLPFWHSYSFFVTYANVDGWKPDGIKTPSSPNELDQWIISLLNHVVASVNKEMEEYYLYQVVPLLVDFIENLTNWYIRRSRRRFWKSENDSDKQYAYETLYYVLVTFSRVMCPFLPFLTEAIYRNLVGSVDKAALESVHLTAYPQADQSLVNLEMETRMFLVRQVVSMGRVLRSKYNIKNRQPLSELTVVIRDEHKRGLVQMMDQLIIEELNVKKVVLDSNEDSLVEISAKPNFRNLGKVFGPQMKEASKEIEALKKEQIRDLEAGGSITILDKPITFEDIELRRTKHEGIEVETEGEVTVALNTEISEELRNEGHAREFINRIQNLRKSQDFNVTDRIVIVCDCDDQFKKALAQFEHYICNETLATSLVWEKPDASNAGEQADIHGFPVAIAIKQDS